MMTLGDRIKAARKLRGFTRPQLSDLSGVKYPTLAGIENNDQSGSTQLPNIAAALGVNIRWLQTGKGQRDIEESEATPDWTDITAYPQRAALGDGAVPLEYAVAHKLKFKSTSLRRKGLFPNKLSVFYGSGDSMLPRIHDGDALLFDMSDTSPRDGKIYVVRYDGDYYAKRLQQYGKHWFLVSDNDSDPKWRKPVPIDENTDFEIVGRVRWIGSWED